MSCRTKQRPINENWYKLILFYLVIFISLPLDWQLNGKSLPSGSKFIPSMDFGFVRLEIKDVLSNNTGILKVIATNDRGSSSSSGSLKLSLKSGDGPNTNSLHPSGHTGITAIEKLEKSVSLKLQDSPEITTNNSIAPHFTTDLPAEHHIGADNIIQLDCKVEPKEDSNLRIDWYHNGIPITAGSRIIPNLEFGFVSLIIKDASARDEGIYTCKAVNSMGEATTFTKVYQLSPTKTGVDFSTMHPHGIEGLESIGKVEARITLADNEETVDTKVPPKFTTSFGDHNLEQGSIGHFEACLEPKEDGDIVLEWKFNGKPLMQSKTFRNEKEIHCSLHSISEIRFKIQTCS